MRWAPKIGMALALAAGAIAAVYLVWSIGFESVFAAIARAGFGGLALLCLFALVVFVSLAFAWYFLLPPAQRRTVPEFYVARLVRDSIAEISPFSPVGGMVAAARLMVLKGMPAPYAAASVAGDATTEAMAQVVFLAFGLGWGLTQFRHLEGSGPVTQAMLAVLLLAVPGIALLIFLQKRGAGFAERMARRFFPQIQSGISFHQAIVELYDSRARLAASAALHLLAWIGAGIGTYIAFRLVGGHIGFLNAVALEALLCTLRSVAAPVPAAIGVQEWGYAMLAPLFGLPAEMGVAVSLLKRAREIVLGVPALIYWQGVESRRAFAAPGENANV
jgi:putative membrane protein